MHHMLATNAFELLARSPLIALWDGAWPYLIMVMGFSLIIFVHEMGHFLVAKWAGVKVERFAVGFGRELVGFTRGETRYSFNMLPFGGYVKMLGQEDFDDKANELKFNDNPRSFVNKPVSHRMAIVSAGVIMNVLFACFLFMIVFLVGKTAAPTAIALIQPDSPADRAGLLPGDIIREINGNRMLEFTEVQMAVLLAPLHEPIDFLVERDGQMHTISLEPKYTTPENTRDPQRQLVGISPGVTRRIRSVGPEVDPSRADHPHVDDVIVEIDGVPVTDENASKVIHMLAYTKADMVVERKDPTTPEAAPQRVQVSVPPILSMHPSGARGEDGPNVLGLVPLVRFNWIDPRGRAYLAGLKLGDTILEWDDIAFPSQKQIARSVRESTDRDIAFRVRRADGTTIKGFVRPEAHERRPATIATICVPIPKEDREDNGPKARFAEVRPTGVAGRSGIKPGDLVLTINDIANPSMTEVNYAIRTYKRKSLFLAVRRPDGQSVRVNLVPEAPGSINARINLVAHDLLRIAGVTATIEGRPSPAAVAGLKSGNLITALNDQPIDTWIALIGAFRQHAGDTVKLSYVDRNGEARTTHFAVPHSLRTLLGVGPEARIVSIDGRKSIEMNTSREPEQVAIGYRRAVRKVLGELVGRRDVEVIFRPTPLAALQTATIDVTEDMIDPWVSRVAFSPNLRVWPETFLLKGKNPLDAIRIGIHKTFYIVLQVYTMMDRMIFTRSMDLKNVSGPLGIIDLGGKVARSGMVDFLFFMGIISANLAVINFLPLPIVDGGLMVFLIIEKIKGTPVSIKVQAATQVIGLFLIIGVFVLVTVNDVIRLWG